MNNPHNNTSQPANRLIHETSPYLLQHAYNPVDWYPWGDEAFTEAKKQDKPIFLSIGYSACHWCHVMEHESFEHPQIAQLMNDYFINIKVDREERPDLDQIYMAAVQLITQRGGWPMSVFLDHDRAPFYGGTYWPPVSRHGMPGFADIIRRVGEYWQQKRHECLQSSREIVEAISQFAESDASPEILTQDLITNAGKKLLRSADQQHGGFGGAPKFPHSMDLRVLIRYAQASKDPEAQKIIKLTLDKMCMGGIYDHLGGGFARYSTDAYWLVPHFEKMLYDNALLVPAYLEGWQLTGDSQYRQVIEETLDYTLKEMTSSDGPFFSTQDADSEGVEGKFYVWTAQEIIDLLGLEEARIFNYVYDVTPQGNWEGHTILNRTKSWDEICKVLQINLPDLLTRLEQSRQKLYQVRSQRIWPGRDEKILTSWNGLMISAMSLAGRMLDQEKYTTAAAQAADFILQHMREPDGRLWHGYKDGRARFNAYLDDYAALADGLLELFMSTGQTKYLTSASELLDRMQAQFADPQDGAYFYTSTDHEQLVLRNKEIQDNATPSGNTLAATAFLKIYHLTGESRYLDAGQQILAALAEGMKQYPLAYGQGLLALSLLKTDITTVVLVPGKNDSENKQLQHDIGKLFLPNCLILWNQAGENSSILQGKTSVSDAPTCYICQQQTCRPPLTEVENILQALQQFS